MGVVSLIPIISITICPRDSWQSCMKICLHNIVLIEQSYQWIFYISLFKYRTVSSSLEHTIWPVSVPWTNSASVPHHYFKDQVKNNINVSFWKTTFQTPLVDLQLKKMQAYCWWIFVLAMTQIWKVVLSSLLWTGMLDCMCCKRDFNLVQMLLLHPLWIALFNIKA